jgi:hypothetical protein
MTRIIVTFPFIVCFFLFSFSLFGNPNFDPKYKKCLDIYNTGVKFHRAGRGYYHAGFKQFEDAKKESDSGHRLSLLQGAYDNCHKGVKELTIAMNTLRMALVACPSDIHSIITKLINDSRNDQSTILTFMLGIKTEEPKIVEPVVK